MKKAIKIVLFSVIGLCAAAVVAGYIALTQIDFNRYKELIIKTVRSSTGRELTIGDIQVKASFNPTIEVKNVTFSNAQWANNPVMVSADVVDLGFAVLPLLRKNVVIDMFKLNGAVINLEESASGEANWEFTLPELPVTQEKQAEFSLIKSAKAAEAAASNDAASFLSALVVKQVALNPLKRKVTTSAC